MSIRTQKNFSLMVFTLLHFLMDLVCSITILIRFNITDEMMLYIVLVYNFVAFMSQPFLGFLVDRFEKKVDERIIVASSFALLFISMFAASFAHSSVFFTISLAVIIGLCNSIFHVAAGKSVLKATTKSRDGGIFVSSGALGIALGSIVYILHDSYLTIAILCVSLIVVTHLCWMMVSIGRIERTTQVSQEKHATSEIVIILVMIALAAFLRSFGGFAFKTDVAFNTILISAVVGAGAFVGKFIGGFLYDLCKGVALIIASLVISVTSLIMLNYVVGDIYLVFLFLFGVGINLLMAYTLDVSKRMLNNHEGTAFGLPAALLFPGMLLAIVYKTLNASNLYLLIFVVVNIALLVVAEFFLRKNKHDSRSPTNR